MSNLAGYHPATPTTNSPRTTRSCTATPRHPLKWATHPLASRINCWLFVYAVGCIYGTRGVKSTFFWLNNKWHPNWGGPTTTSSAIHLPPSAYTARFPPLFRWSSLIGVEWSLPCGWWNFPLLGWKVVTLKGCWLFVCVCIFYGSYGWNLRVVRGFAKSRGRAWNLLT